MDKAIKTGKIYRVIFFILPVLSEIIIGLLMREILIANPGAWQERARRFIEKGKEVEEGRMIAHPNKAIIEEKISKPGFKTSLRIAASSDNLLSSLIGAFGAFVRGDGNSLTFKKAKLWQKKKFLTAIQERSFVYHPVEIRLCPHLCSLRPWLP